MSIDEKALRADPQFILHRLGLTMDGMTGKITKGRDMREEGPLNMVSSTWAVSLYQLLEDCESFIMENSDAKSRRL